MFINKFFIFGMVFWCVFFCSGCFGRFGQFVTKGRGQAEVKRNYNRPQCIMFKNYILYNTKDKNNIISTNEYIWSSDVDSLIGVFSNSLEKLELGVIDSSIYGENFIEEKFVTQQIIRLKKVDEDWIKSVAYNDNGTDCLIIVPFIYLYNRINFTGFIGSSGVAGNDGFFISTTFDLLIFLIEENEIKYKKHMRYVAERSNYVQTLFEAQELVEKIPMVRQEHWDELVRLTMKDYMKRMK